MTPHPSRLPRDLPAFPDRAAARREQDATLDRVVGERDRYKDALERICAQDERGPVDYREARMMAREALRDG